jgi:hypothetical protein
MMCAVSGGLDRSVAARRARSVLGERLGGFIYGTILVLAVLVAGARAYPAEPGHIAVLVVVSSGVFWLAHVYAHGLAHSVAHDEHLSLAVLRRIARHEAAIMEATVPPIAALLLGTLGVLAATSAIWTAFVLGLVVLCVEGVVFARTERYGLFGTLVVVGANLALGLVLVGLKVLVTH